MVYKNMAVVYLVFAVIAFCFLAFESRGLAGEPNKGIASLSDQALEKLTLAKIYFGHQSVGSNIMEGVNDLMGQDPRLKLKIEETDTPSTFQGGVFSHGPVGKNENPASKIDDFADKINAGRGWSGRHRIFQVLLHRHHGRPEHRRTLLPLPEDYG